MDKLLEGKYYSEYPELGLKIRNVKGSNQIRLYNLIIGMDLKDFRDERLLYTIACELTESNGMIDFKKIDFSEFSKLIKSDNKNEVWEDIINDITLIIIRIVKNGLKIEQLKIEAAKVELINIQMKKDYEEYVEVAAEILKRERANKKNKKIKKKAKKSKHQHLIKIIEENSNGI
ncbi:MAG: hypothetical protein RR909_04115 [Bacilli bacterium]